MLAQTGEQRSPIAPHVPTMEESGLPGFIVRSGFSFLGPAGMPRAIVEKLNAALVASLRDPANHKLLTARGTDPMGTTSEEHARYISSEVDKWIKAARVAGITPE